MSNATGESTAPIVTIAAGRATIRLNRPRERNRIEPDDLAVLRQAFTRISKDPDIRVLVIGLRVPAQMPGGLVTWKLCRSSMRRIHGSRLGCSASAAVPSGSRLK